MNTKQKLPSDALKRTSPVRAVITAAAAVVLVAGLGTAAFAIGPTLRAGINHPTATATAAPVDTAPTLSPDELARVQGIADTQQTKLAADQKAAADAAAAQAAADAAAQAAAKRSSGPIRCPAGSSANSNDGVNDTSCFPTICFGITVPDPAHPECNVAFKP